MFGALDKEMVQRESLVDHGAYDKSNRRAFCFGVRSRNLILRGLRSRQRDPTGVNSHAGLGDGTDLVRDELLESTAPESRKYRHE